MFENKNHIKIKSSSERNFGIVFGIFFLIICFYPILQNKPINYWALFISIIFFVLSFFLPKILSIPNKLWFKFGLLLGHIISPLIMGLVFFVTIVPTSIIIKLVGKKLMLQKINKNIHTYWVEKKEINTSMKNQF
ncbi:MAG: hypothetical protein CFH18_00887 [Alphaproteobacteria bacterium MarineAlpha5_Bin8]|mgnify:CR=1 FL=1|nr:MAG: hypothetical protein CFH18_00887 [Alphaproteobacteria bacterium MarineAlpha5_Bin8]PPR46085.1 MAG: hypothetical protein CFH17_00186 [Alphaproteobacteria bacterium MarineAlpha5_Bin7]|tara:strand:+ start:2098 stop:2502 length:405 start_codon:yes stop_codon:yes gene_type:complete